MIQVRNLTERGRYLVALLLMLLVAVAFAMAQPETPPATEPVLPFFPPVIYFGVLALGMLGHWAKGFTRGSIAEGLGAYLLTNMGQTVSAIVANIGALMLLWKTSPTDMWPVSGFAVWTVFMTAYVGNSALNGTGSFVTRAAKPPSGG
jgi:hypothetical protein